MAKSKRRRMHPCQCPTCQVHPSGKTAQRHRAINRVLVLLDEKNRRRFVGLLALQWGARTISFLRQITGLSRNTIQRGKQELEHPSPKHRGRIRAPGGGRVRVEKKVPVFLPR